MIFYMADSPHHYTDHSNSSPLQNTSGCIAGMQSVCAGTVHLNGVYHRFIIQFKANGYHRLFQIPAKDLVDQLHCMNDVFGNAANAFNEKLKNAAGILEMAKHANDFLLPFLKRQKKTTQQHDGISFVANELLTNAALLSIEDYACKANMSVRNFGRRFVEQVGVSPKFYCRLLRFNNAISTKIQKPSSTWTAIAHECGYFDQMHMIKDFKQFAGVNPGDLFDNTREFSRPRIDVSNSSNRFFNNLNSTLHNEKFVKLG